MSTLEAVSTDLFVANHPEFSLMGLTIGHRTTILRQGDALMVHSPGPLTPKMLAEIQGLGRVEAVVSPNLVHHFFLRRAQAGLQATDTPIKLFARPEIAKKTAKSQPDLTIDGDATDVALHKFADVVALDGMPGVQEVAYIHGPSRTVILTDSAFNVRNASFGTRTFMRINGGYDRFGPTRIFRSFIKDRSALRRSIDQLLEHDFDRAIVAHGEILPTGAKDILRESWAFLK